MISNHDRDKTIEESILYIKSLARKQTRPGFFLDADDLLQEGVIGLMDALTRYTRSDVPPLGYAAHRIAGQMIDAKRKAMLLHRNSDGTIPEQPKTEDISCYYERTLNIGAISALGKKFAMPENMMTFDDYMEEEASLHAAMRRLRPTQRRLLESLYFKEIDRRDLAKELGIGLEKLWWKEQNALRDLKRIITGMEVSNAG